LGKALKADRLVYHPYDEFASYPEISRQVVELERKAVEDADVVIAASEVVAQTLRGYSDRQVHVIPNGADYDYFSGAEVPDGAIPNDVSAIPTPRMAYIGNISAKVDIGLFKCIAEARPDWSIVIVGGNRLNRDEDRRLFSEVVALPNVHWLGHKPYDEVAPYVCSMDVNLLAYRVGEGMWSEACSPLKLYEYMAAGKPIVSCKLAAAQAHTDVLDIAESVQEWVDSIDSAIRNFGPESREKLQRVAFKNSWAERIHAIEHAIDQ
jgi:glycosyltransferase involved in cell wall biosynthesis